MIHCIATRAMSQATKWKLVKALRSLERFELPRACSITVDFPRQEDGGLPGPTNPGFVVIFQRRRAVNHDAVTPDTLGMRKDTSR